MNFSNLIVIVAGIISLPFRVRYRVLIVCLAAAFVLVAGLVVARFGPVTSASGPLRQDAYVWQRDWSESVIGAVREHAPNFSELIVLSVEVSWTRGRPQVVRVPLDFETLRKSGKKVGLALRIGAYSGSFKFEDEHTRWLSSLAVSIVNEAAIHQIRPAEVQIDFDCPESKLDGYRVWVEAVRSKLTPVPVTITALPAWLKHRALKHLIDSADGFVLQVHSLERPQGPDKIFKLCDTRAAKRAVEQAARMGKPFRVALPTYGYLIAFDPAGRFFGISADGSTKNWPENFQIREIRTPPNEMADLIRDWTNHRPRALEGVIWYRLPIAGENLNWRWPTLAAVMTGQTPRPLVRAESHQDTTGLIEIEMINTGQAEFGNPFRVKVRWQDARLVALDGLRGVEATESGTNVVEFASTPDFVRLEPGETRQLGWVRLNRRSEAAIETDFDKK